MLQIKSDQNYSNPIVLFDGVCNLCTTSVQFLLAYNRKENLHFASLQSDFAQELLIQYKLTNEELSTIIFIENERIYTKSTAVLELTKHLIYPWRALYFFKFVPRMITDWVYNLISKNRYNWFGKKNQCMIPKPEWKHRFSE
ncbi:thiol-disulfide oxidoreductase DCC family protein [Labilibaculum sp. K2S]|uniref:thiol-disulfide oxidoreductase DCC family protein n=1 Tax=Labilibaculum sp. K2S TaxID=3056386 RepID=UPI0025A3D05C|nr:thiol-disulfide oxidoreductase DCC family protein [Labilibaculum sp. K2S]MDM8159494.1 thiol-disulfide oxidoreductase DCC family protein [Labilibaculum sp. K2S]